MKRRLLILLAVYALIALAAIAAGIRAFTAMQQETRGVTYLSASAAPRTPAALAVNTALDQYTSDADLRHALTLIRNNRFTLVRQHFYWNDIEPRAGEFAWDKWDRIVAAAGENGVELSAVLDTTPEWARDPGERDLLNAPPARVEDYARFAGEFVKRYGDRIHSVQLWDNPNVHPYWGRRVVDPIEYTALLRAGALAARAANPTVQVIAAGLAPNGELVRGRADYSDVLFLRGMYDAGARDYFDILAAKPYGMWTGPDDRRVGMDVFNFSRVILLRDEMVAHGDAAKPVWAVEFGWNALPQGWEGKPSPWGTDTEQVQAARDMAAVRRAGSEWPWLAAMFIQTFQPNAPKDDPVWGFALYDANFQPRLLNGVTAALDAPVAPATFDFPRFYAALGVLALAALAAVGRGAVLARGLPWADGWSVLEARFRALPEPAQFAVLALGAAAFYYSPSTVLNFGLLALVVLLFALRLDLGLVIAVFTIPFYLFPKNLVGSAQFSLVEMLTLACVAASVGRQLAFDDWRLAAGDWRTALANLRTRLTSLDWALVVFVAAGVISVRVAGNFGVANRELRVIVLEPALLYALIRLTKPRERAVWRLVDAFALSALAVSLIGLYQYFFTNWVITGEGVRRVLAVYGSPNNLALYLDRALPLLIAAALFVEDKRRRIMYAALAMPIALSWYLTWSRAAWIGLFAALVFIGLFSGRRVRLIIVALAAAGLVLLIPFLSTERAQSLFQTGSGTGFFRLSVMQSGVDMLRDHPIFGVGLDNFLYEYPRYIKPEAWAEPNLSHPHNIVLDFWLRMGILGVVTLGWMLVEFYRRGLSALTRARGSVARVDANTRACLLGLMAGMVAALVHGMMDAAYFYVDLAFVWMLFLGIMAQVTGTQRSIDSRDLQH